MGPREAAGPPTVLRAAALTTLLALGQAPAAAERTLLVYGDSLSAAYGIDEAQGWVALLAGRLEGTGWRVVNGSVSGETSTGGLARLPGMLDSHAPELVILELGGNDGLRGLPLAALRRNLEAMADLIRARGADALLVGIRLPPNYGPRYTGPFFELFGEVAAARGLPLVPFLLEGVAARAGLMQDDGIHPKAEAQPMILDNVWPRLAPLLEPRAGRPAHPPAAMAR